MRFLALALWLLLCAPAHAQYNCGLGLANTLGIPGLSCQTSLDYSLLGPTLQSGFVFARATSKTCWNGTALVTVGSGVPCFEAAGGPLGGYGLLLEGQFQNFFLQSGFVSGWLPSANTAVNASSDTAPDGGTSYKLTGNSGVTSEYCYQAVSFISGSKYLVQVFAKPIGSNSFAITSFTQSGHARFTLSGAGSLGAIDGIVASSGIQLLSSGWYFCWAIMTASSTASNTVGFQNLLGGYVGDNWSIWGAQIGLSSIAAPTSYVPTTTTAVTRAADSLSLPASAVPWINPPAGYTVAASLDTLATGAQVGTGGLIEAYQDGNNYDLAVAASGSGLYFQKIIGGVTQQVFSSTLSAANHLIAYADNGTVVTGNLDGSVVTTPSNPGTLNLSNFYFGNVQSGSYPYPIHLHRLRLWGYPMNSTALGGLAQ